MTIAELEECVDIYGKEIFGFCRHITGSWQEGEELYQDTFLKAVELSAKIDRSKNPKSYLLSIAIRLWKNGRRKSAWRQRIANMESLEERMEEGYLPLGEETQQPEHFHLLREQSLLVRKCMEELPEKYRLCILLYYAAELSVKEIAGCLKVPEGTIKSRLNKGRKMIKEKLEVAGYDK